MDEIASTPAPLPLGTPVRRRLGRRTVAVVALALIGLWVGLHKDLTPYKVTSGSMEPTLQCAKPAPGCDGSFSDRVIANRLAYRFHDPHRGDIVVFTAPAEAKQQCSEGGTFVKRIVGLPGEVVSERAGTVYIDGKPLHEAYVDPRRRDSTTQTWPRVPKDEYFVMGDNRASSCDSREWGPVPRENLIGPVLLTYWPPNRISFR